MSKQTKFSQTLKSGRVRLRKRADSGIWYACYQTSGKWKERSLGTTSKKEAIKEAELISSQLLDKKYRIADGSVPVDYLFNKFFLAKKHHSKKETTKKFQTAIGHFKRWAQEEAPNIKNVSHVTPSIVRELQKYRIENDRISKRTADNTITDLNTIFKWGEKEGLVQKSPFDYSKDGNIQLFMTRRKREQHASNNLHTYTKDEYYAFITVIMNKINEFDQKIVVAKRKTKLMVLRKRHQLIHDLIVVLANTGMRFNEAANLTSDFIVWGDVPYIDIRARNGWTPKDAEEVKRVPMTQEVQSIIRRLEAQSKNGYLFQNSEGNRIAENHTLKSFKSLFSDVGIKTDERRLHWHSWRNYFIIGCLEEGAPIRDIMEWTGHDSAKMLLHYSLAKSKQSDSFDSFRKLSTWGKYGEDENKPQKPLLNMP